MKSITKKSKKKLIMVGIPLACILIPCLYYFAYLRPMLVNRAFEAAKILETSHIVYDTDTRTPDEVKEDVERQMLKYFDASSNAYALNYEFSCKMVDKQVNGESKYYSKEVKLDKVISVKAYFNNTATVVFNIVQDEETSSTRGRFYTEYTLGFIKKNGKWLVESESYRPLMI